MLWGFLVRETRRAKSGTLYLVFMIVLYKAMEQTQTLISSVPERIALK